MPDGKPRQWNWDETLFWNVYYVKGAFLDADKAFETMGLPDADPDAADPGAEAAGDPDLRPVPGAHFDAALEVVDLDPATRIQRPGLVDRGGGECRARCGSNDQDRGQGQDRGFQGQGHIGLLQA